MRNDLIALMIQKTVMEAKKGISLEKKLSDTISNYYTGNNNGEKKQVSERTRLARSFYRY